MKPVGISVPSVPWFSYGDDANKPDFTTYAIYPQKFFSGTVGGRELRMNWLNQTAWKMAVNGDHRW